MNELPTAKQEQPFINIVVFRYGTVAYGAAYGVDGPGTTLPPGAYEGHYVSLRDHNAVVAKLRKQLESLQAWSNVAEEMLEQYRDEASTHTRMAEIAKVINSVPA